MNDHALDLQGVSKSFTPGQRIVSDISMQLAAGEIVCLLGPSGCGKTTLLRMIAGLETPDEGAITMAGRTVASAGAQLVPPHGRDIGMVFQSYALWPHMSVLQNVEYPLRRTELSRQDRRAHALETLEQVGLGQMAGRQVSQLSGGQQQRVALARAIAARPGLVLFDEPLSNLDVNLRTAMRRQIRTVLKDAGLTGLYVTHDQGEAFAVADRIMVLGGGQVLQAGSATELTTRPESQGVVEFLGLGNVLHGACIDASAHDRTITVKVAGVEAVLPLAEGQVLPSTGGELEVFVPRGSVALGSAGMPGRVVGIDFAGPGEWTVTVRVDQLGSDLEVALHSPAPVPGLEESVLVEVVEGVRLLPPAA